MGCFIEPRRSLRLRVVRGGGGSGVGAAEVVGVGSAVVGGGVGLRARLSMIGLMWRSSSYAPCW